MTARAKKTVGAKSPERVLDKVCECRFFLTQMATYERGLENEKKFLYCLSAFMSAFRTVASRLYGVNKHRFGKQAGQELKHQLRSKLEIGFLLDKTNVELHEDGVIVFRRFKVRAADPSPGAEGRFAGRFLSRYGWREGLGIVITHADGWQFAESSKNLIELCDNALGTMEEFIHQILPTDPNEAQPPGHD